MLETNYLNAGSGKPWAGQIKAIDDSSENTTVLLLSVEENFGLALPIGSRVLIIKKLNFISNDYLNDGTGAPWAGQERAIISFSFLTKRLNLVSEENLGAAPPMGSKEGMKTYEIVCISFNLRFCLNAGIGEQFSKKLRRIYKDGMMTA